MISPLAHVDPAAKIGENVIIHPFAFIDADVTIGDGCEIMPFASVMHGTTLGREIKVYQGAVVGADPQDFRWKGRPSRCSVGDKTIIREQVIINRGFLTEQGTVIGDKCFIMAETHIGHDSVIGYRCVLGNGVKIAGSTNIDEHSILSSNVVLHENARLGKWVFIKGGTRVSSNVPPYVVLAHNPVAYYGVNAVVMSRKKFSNDDIDIVAKAYRHLYQSQTSVFNAVKRIEADLEPSEIRDEIVNFIVNSNYHIAGTRVEADLD